MMRSNVQKDDVMSRGTRRTRGKTGINNDCAQFLAEFCEELDEYELEEELEDQVEN